MDRVRTILAYRSPYPHAHSKHAILTVAVGCLFFISSDSIHTLIQKFSIKWWSMYACLFGSFYFFSSPFMGKTIKPSYSIFSRWYILWLLVAALYHFPSFQSMGVDLRMNLSVFLTTYMYSIFFLLTFHVVFLGLWYVGLVSRVAGKRPAIQSILQNCTAISIACCVFYSRCGNRAIMREKPFERTLSGLFKLWNKEDSYIWLAKFLRVNKWKDHVCSSWFAPVGSASDYPFYSKWVIYGELTCQGPSCAESPDEISPIFSLWATYMGLYMANYVIERSSGWALSRPLSLEETQKLKEQQKKPKFLEMVPWYSGTSADLFKTVFDLLVSVAVFVGRFDMRMMQAAMSKIEGGAEREDLLYDHFSDKDEIWFDFMADTGDGGNSSYSVARLLAQPTLEIRTSEEVLTLPRADLLIIGGDLAYPNPSASNYEKRLFLPFEDALQPPVWYKKEHIAIRKPELPFGVAKLKHYDGPQCFAIPGNHDWFDGLQTYMRYICHKSWLGGWFMPQKRSYFALQLPKGWWVFGLDLALHNDIDVYQFQFFSELINSKVAETDSVLIMTHEPNWLLDWYWSDVTGKNVSYLIRDHLRGRCKARVAGDLHHYMRHSYVPSDKPPLVHHLIVNGCGGAFLHPTHVFSNFNKLYETSYETKAAYPSFEDSSRIALGNILKFRKKNWQFDFIGGVIYFILASSMFPQDDTFSGHLKSFFNTVWYAFMYMLGHSYISLAGAMVLLTVAVIFVPSKMSRKRRLLIGALHVAAHVTAALILMLLLELAIETCIRHKLLETSGYHTLYKWYRSVESKHFPDRTGLRARIEQWTYGLYPACIKYLMSAFDVPEVMAVTRNKICKNGMESLSRGGAVIYYTSIFLYFWVLSTPVVSLIFGSYLYVCINWLHLHFDEAFSSLRIANYKSFTRFHINRKGDLEVFTLAVDKVPKEWKLDPNWDGELTEPEEASYHGKYPSKWCAKSPEQDPTSTVRIIDRFVIEKTHSLEVEHTNRHIASNRVDDERHKGKKVAPLTKKKKRAMPQPPYNRNSGVVIRSYEQANMDDKGWEDRSTSATISERYRRPVYVINSDDSDEEFLYAPTHMRGPGETSGVVASAYADIDSATIGKVIANTDDRKKRWEYARPHSPRKDWVKKKICFIGGILLGDSDMSRFFRTTMRKRIAGCYKRWNEVTQDKRQEIWEEFMKEYDLGEFEESFVYEIFMEQNGEKFQKFLWDIKKEMLDNHGVEYVDELYGKSKPQFMPSDEVWKQYLDHWWSTAQKKMPEQNKKNNEFDRKGDATHILGRARKSLSTLAAMKEVGEKNDKHNNPTGEVYNEALHAAINDFDDIRTVSRPKKDSLVEVLDMTIWEQMEPVSEGLQNGKMLGFCTCSQARNYMLVHPDPFRHNSEVRNQLEKMHCQHKEDMAVRVQAEEEAKCQLKDEQDSRKQLEAQMAMFLAAVQNCVPGFVMSILPPPTPSTWSTSQTPPPQAPSRQASSPQDHDDDVVLQTQ